MNTGSGKELPNLSIRSSRQGLGDEFGRLFIKITKRPVEATGLAR